MTKMIQTCSCLSQISYLPNLSVNQLQVMLLVHKWGGATSNRIAQRLDYDTSEVTKIITYIRHTLADRPQLVQGLRVGHGKGSPKVWTLTPEGNTLITQYLEQLS